MNRLKVLGCLIFLFGFNNLFFAYDYPCFPPFSSSSRPYSFANSPASLFLSQERAAFAFQITVGEYSYPPGCFPKSLFPWPEIQSFWHFKYNKIGGSVALIDKYQYTFREEIDCISPEGNYLGKGFYWGSRFIYALRVGLAYQFSPVFVFGLGGDINYGFFRNDFQLPEGVYWIPEDVKHMQFSDVSSSFNLGGAFISRVNHKIFEVFYESRTQMRLFDGALIHFLPAQISISLNLPVGVVDVETHYYRRFGKCEYVIYYPDTVKTIASNDFALSFLIPARANIKFYFAFYSLPLTYDISSKGFGFSFGPKLANRGFLKEFLVIYETGTARVSEILGEWRLTRYGIRLGVSL